MTHATESLPPSIRSLEDRAERDLAMLDRMKPPTLSKAIRQGGSAADGPDLAGNAGDSGDTGDNAFHGALLRPQSAGASGENGDKSAPSAHFLLLERREGQQAAGVYWCDVTREAHGEVTGQAAPVWICSPLTVAGMTRDAQGSEWGRLLVFPDHDGTQHRWTMPMELLAGNGEELRRELLREGLRITSSARDRARLVDYIMRGRPDVLARCVKRTGWHGDVFVLPRETFGDTDAEPVLFQAATMDGVTLGWAGTLAGWREEVAARCAGNARLVLAICAGFAGPCLGLLSMAGGGFHLRGGSSTGKTTALLVAASLFGSPGYLRTWRHTDNGLEGVAGMHSDLLLVLDEIGELAPKIAGATAYMLANGQGKGRAARDGSPRALTTWRVLFLSSGEVALSDLVTQAGGKVRAGQEVRVIDLPADAGAGLGLFDTVPEGMSAGAFADAIKAAAGKHYGHALPAFLRALVADPAKAREALAALRDTITAELVDANADGQVRRVAQRFALVAAAGELATTYRLTGWQTGEATRAASACFAAWLAGRGTAKASEPVAMLAQVRAFLSAHGEARFTDWHADDRSPRTANRAGFRKSGTDGPTYYVETEAFRREMCAGFDYHAVEKVLVDADALAAGGDGRATQKPRLPDGRSPRVYVITPALWGAE
jgi:putative DNA primase/helicase